MDVFALDRVQKNLAIDDAAARHLRKVGLIEGRKPNFHVSSKVAKVLSAKADYIRRRALDDEYCKKLILDYLQRFQPATRQDLDSFLMEKLGDVLTEKQKISKVGNLLTRLRRAGKIANSGSRKSPAWKIAE
jgi:ATP-dependent DNA helicase RecG